MAGGGLHCGRNHLPLRHPQGRVWDSSISEKVVWSGVRQSANKAATEKTYLSEAAPLSRWESWSRSSFCSDIAQRRLRSGILAPGSGSCVLSTTSWASSRIPHRAKQVTENAT